MTTVLDVEKLRLPSLEAHSNAVAANRQWTYFGAVGPSTEVRLVPFVNKLTHEILSYVVIFLETILISMLLHFQADKFL